MNTTIRGFDVFRIFRCGCSMVLGLIVMYYGAALYGGIAATAHKLYFVAPIFLGMAIGYSMSLFAVREESKLNRWSSYVAGALSLIGVILGNFFTSLYMVLAEEKSDPVSIYTITKRLLPMICDYESWPIIFKLAFNDFGLYEIICCIMGSASGWGMFAKRRIPSFGRTLDKDEMS